MKINLKEVFICLTIGLLVAWLSRYAGGTLVTPYISGVASPTFKHGWPMNYYYKGACGIIALGGRCPPGWIDLWAFVLNLIFWFLLVFGSWQVFKFIKIRIKK